jgi:hypothetical protein
VKTIRIIGISADLIRTALCDLLERSHR